MFVAADIIAGHSSSSGEDRGAVAGKFELKGSLDELTRKADHQHLVGLKQILCFFFQESCRAYEAHPSLPPKKQVSKNAFLKYLYTLLRESARCPRAASHHLGGGQNYGGSGEGQRKKTKKPLFLTETTFIST